MMSDLMLFVVYLIGMQELGSVANRLLHAAWYTKEIPFV